MSKPALAAICTTCSASLYEGQSALYDDYRDQHFCGRSCYSDWWADNTDVLAEEYRKLNVERAEL